MAYNKMEKQNDACYWEISANFDDVNNISDPLEGIRIFIKIQALKNMNVYIYGGGGRSRTQAMTPGTY